MFCLLCSINPPVIQLDGNRKCSFRMDGQHVKQAQEAAGKTVKIDPFWADIFTAAYDSAHSRMSLKPLDGGSFGTFRLDSFLSSQRRILTAMIVLCICQLRISARTAGSQKPTLTLNAATLWCTF